MSRSRKRWSEADLEHARALYEGGLSFAQLGRELGYSATWLARVFKKAGVPVRPSGRPMTSPAPTVDLDELKALRETGWTYVELGTRYGISTAMARAKYFRLVGRPLNAMEARRRAEAPRGGPR